MSANSQAARIRQVGRKRVVHASPHRMLVALVSAGLLPFVAACATGAPLVPDRGIDDGAATLVVENASFDDVRVYLVRGTMREPLGVVGAASRERIRIPVSRLGHGDIEFLAEPRISSGPSRSVTGIRLFAGDTLQWSIDNSRALVHVFRR